MAMSGATDAPPAAHSNSGPEQAIDVHQPFTPAERVQQLSQVDNDIASLLQHLASAMRALAAIPPDTDQLANNNSNNHNHHSLINGSSSSSSSSSPPPASSSPPSPDPTAAAITDPLASFRTAQTAFFRTVDRIDKQLTRQILALEEAGIITLRDGGGGIGAAGGDQELSEAVAVADGGMIGGGGAGAGATVAAAAAGRVTARLEPDGLGRYGGLDVGRLNATSSTVERDMEAELWRRAREHLGAVVEEGAGERMEE